VVIPAWIKRHGGGSTVALMTLYSAMLSLGAASGPLLAVPLSGAGAEGWRDSIQAWGILAAVPMVFAIVVLTRTGNDFPGRLPSTAEAAEGTDQGPDTVSRSGGRRSTSLWRSPTAIALTCMFGLQSMNAYTQFGFLPSILTDAGLPAGTTGIYTAQIAGWGVIGGLLMPTVIARSTRLSWWCACFGALTALGWLGLLLAPTSAPTFWSALLGIGGFAFPTAIALIPARSRLPMVTARLSGMVQPVGYLLAGCGPLLLGVLLDATGSMVSVLSLMILRRILLGIAGWRAGSPRMVDDDLA
jgi:CP family cyanate transporter-like MFS transporter